MIPTREEQDALAASLGFKAVEMEVSNDGASWTARTIDGYNMCGWWDGKCHSYWPYARPIQPKRRVPMTFCDKCRVLADGGELGYMGENKKIYKIVLLNSVSSIDLAPFYRTGPDASWMPCEKEVGDE